MTELPEDSRRHRRISKADREKIRQALLAGERGVELAARFGVTKQAISLIKRSLDAEAGDPTAKAQIAKQKSYAPPGKRYSKEEWEELARAMQSGSPADHGLNDDDLLTLDRWNLDRAGRLGENLFGRPPTHKRLKEFLVALIPDAPLASTPKDRPPDAPVRLTPETVTPEFRDDAEYVAYVTSDTYWEIQQRTYKLELEEYERRQAGLPPRESKPKEPRPPSKTPGGFRPKPTRHRGPNFTKSKRKDRKKKRK